MFQLVLGREKCNNNHNSCAKQIKSHIRQLWLLLLKEFKRLQIKAQPHLKFISASIICDENTFNIQCNAKVASSKGCPQVASFMLFTKFHSDCSISNACTSPHTKINFNLFFVNFKAITYLERNINVVPRWNFLQCITSDPLCKMFTIHLIMYQHNLKSSD